MALLITFFRVKKFIFNVDNAACDDGSENDFTELSTGDYVKHPDSLVVSSKSASESNHI